MTETSKRPRKRSARSSVEELPPQIKTAVDDALKAGVTLDEIVKAVEAAGAEVSRSALGRYKLKFHRLGERLTRTRQMAEMFVDRLGAAPEGKQGRIITELAQSMIFDFLTPGDDGETRELDTEGFMLLAKSIKDLAYAEKISADREMKIREEERKRTLAEAKAAAAAAVDKVARTVGGLTRETVTALKAEFLGIK